MKTTVPSIDDDDPSAVAAATAARRTFGGCGNLERGQISLSHDTKTPSVTRSRRRQRSATDFIRSGDGVAAIEFSLLLPVLLLMLIGSVELINWVDHRRKLQQLARTLADLTSQGDVQSPIRSSVMDMISRASGPILAPYGYMGVTVTISSIGVYLNVAPYVCSFWTTATAQTAGRTVGPALPSDIRIPDNYQRSGARYVLAELSAPHRLLLGATATNFVSGIIDSTLREKVSWPVRGGSVYSASSDPEIILPSGQKCP